MYSKETLIQVAANTSMTESDSSGRVSRFGAEMFTALL